MAKKQPYEPHRRLATHVVPSATEYNRARNQAAIEAEVEMYEEKYSEDIQEEELTERNLAEHGMHIVGDFR